MAEDKFDPDRYLQTRFRKLNMKGRILFPLEMFHKEFSALPGSLKILDYGTGPVIMTLISASTKASEIIISDLSSDSRNALRSWLANKPEAFNWSPHFQHVVQNLEGKGVEEVSTREALVREKVKKVVSCNIHESPIIEEGYEGPYDVVSSSGCLDSACVSRDNFEQSVKNLAALVKPGGTMLLYLSERDMKTETGKYYIGTRKYVIVNVRANYMVDLLKSIGFSNVKCESCPCDTAEVHTFQDGNLLGYLFASGVKNEC